MFNVKTWNYKQINQIHIELSNNCNAMCPMCPRQTAGRIKEYSLHSISLDEFQKWLPPDFIRKIRVWIFCGTRGDPMMCLELLEILKYILSINPAAKFHMNTNGSTRNSAFWTELGKIMSVRFKRGVVFSLDGLEDTNHLYRRNVNWKRVMENAKTFIAAGGQAHWEFLIFKHNEHQLAEAEAQAKEMGFVHFVPKKALGFAQSGTTPAYDKDGKVIYLVEAPTLTENQNYIGVNTVPEFDNLNAEECVRNDTVWEQTTLASALNISNRFVTSEEVSNLKNAVIQCRSIDGDRQEHEFYIGADGIVSPCCYVGTNGFSQSTSMVDQQLQIRMRQYGLDKFNLAVTPLVEIVQHLNTLYAKSWESDVEFAGRIMFCAKTCTKNSAINTIYTHTKNSRDK